MSEYETVKQICSDLNKKYGHAIAIHYSTFQGLEEGADVIEKQANEALSLVEDIRKRLFPGSSLRHS